MRKPLPNMSNLDITIRLYCFIKTYVDEEGFPPSVREMAEGCYIGATTVNRHLDRLEAWGYIEREPGIPRGLRLAGIPPFGCH
jgi:repressor LexA